MHLTIGIGCPIIYDLTPGFSLGVVATFGRGPATRHLVTVASLNPTTDTLGPCGTLAWSTTIERLYQVCKFEPTGNVSHHPRYLGRNSGAPDRPIPVYSGLPDPSVLGPGKFADPCFLDNFN